MNLGLLPKPQIRIANDKQGMSRDVTITLSFIVAAGWPVSSLGHFFGYLLCSVVGGDALNLVYNLPDINNMIALCSAIWNCAKKDTQGRTSSTLKAAERSGRQPTPIA